MRDYDRLMRDRQLLTAASRISEQLDAVERSYGTLGRIEPCPELTTAADALRSLRWRLEDERTQILDQVTPITSTQENAA